MKRDPQEPRSQLVLRLTSAAIRASGLTINAFATRVADEYIARVALHERTTEFHSGETVDAAAKAEKANAQLISRIMNGVVKFPADLEEAWVAALPDDARTEVVRALAARYGLLAARMPVPADDVRGQMDEFANLSREFGQTIVALAPIFADGKCDEGDRANIQRALKESNDLTEAILALQAQLRMVVEPRNVVSLTPLDRKK